eukprot:TRINITY_DN28048_c0_g1_i1.p1 TRINITY_DN28048_c0_g1~~TRINITY_DN28048_c0_g1_i1.p1  ORF type:complete len:204 (+),score=14.36 TRINITY_DN28048_c0_g1_i1:43-612(+)
MDFLSIAASYPGIVFLMFLENVFPPIPSELIMTFAGYKTHLPEINLFGVIVAGTIGSTLGQIPLYYIGKSFGKERLKKLARKYGEFLAVGPEDIDRADSWLKQYGNIAILFSRVMPGIRSLISIPAGFAGMNFIQFLIYSAIGTSFWVGVLAFIGSLLGERYALVGQYLKPLTYLTLAVIVILFALQHP